MRWFISVKLAAAVLLALLLRASQVYACAQCYASAGPTVVRAYLVSAFCMIGLAWVVIGAISLYALRVCRRKPESKDLSVRVQKTASTGDKPTVAHLAARHSGGSVMLTKQLYVLVGLLIGGALTLSGARPIAAETVEVKVRMYDTPAAFVPDPVKIKVGDTVVWSNKGDTVHTATTDPAQAPNPGFASVPTGAATFDSGFLNGGENFSYTFKVPGVYHYFCTTHVKEGMKGEVDVEK
jgi:plastocyanin